MDRLSLAPYKQACEACSWIEWHLSDPGSWVHCHHFREIFWILSGEGLHQVNQRQYPVGENSLVFVHQDDAHTLGPVPGKHLRFVNLAFERGSWEHLRLRYWAGLPDPSRPMMITSIGSSVSAADSNCRHLPRNSREAREICARWSGSC